MIPEKPLAVKQKTTQHEGNLLCARELAAPGIQLCKVLHTEPVRHATRPTIRGATTGLSIPLRRTGTKGDYFFRLHFHLTRR
jgi:hypothetical protein